MANNPFQTPASPWTIVHSNGLVLNTTARVTRLTTQWATPTGAFPALKTTWNGASGAAITGFGYALKYLAAGLAANATNAYTNALSEPAASAQFETDNPRGYVHSVPYAYAWCKAGLSGAQQTDLLTRIESNQVSLEANIGALGKYLIDGCGNGNVGMPGYIFNWCAADGQAGITDRSTNVRNLVQNTVLYINQQYNEGIWTSYDNLYDLDLLAIIAFHIATGNESLLASRCPSVVGRGEVLARMLEASGNNFYSMTPHNARLDLTGKFLASGPANAWCTSMYSDITRDTTMAWVRDQQLAHCTPTAWSHLQLISDPTWLGFFFYDPTLVGVSPTTAGLTKCKAYVQSGVVEFRGGWNQATDLVCNFTGGAPLPMNDHAIPNAGCIQIRVGPTWLVSDGYNYSHRASAWEAGVPAAAGEVGAYTMRNSGLSFSPSATQATREDRDGSAAVVQTTGSQTAFPLSYSFTNNVRQTWLSGTMGALYDDGALAKITADISAAFPQMTSVKRTVGYIRGATSGKGTIVIYDQFTAPGTIDHIRANFWSKFKPSGYSSETVLQGTSAAGVTQWGGNKVIHVSGGVQATIQCASTLSRINGVGGAGFESFFDGYNSGGANLDFVANGGGDSRNPTEFLWMNNNATVPGQIQWRSSFQTTQAAAGGIMVYVITVDTAGTTAPTYTLTQALNLLNPATGGPTMPGMTQFAQKRALDWSIGKTDVGLPTLYCALFNTVPADDGTGGTEVNASGYARVALSSSTWTASSGGSPATTSNNLAITFPQAGASWGTINGWGLFDAATNGNLWWSDFLGNSAWAPFTGSSASPSVLTSPAHGLSNGNLIAVTSKYGGTLPATAGSWGGILTVANATTDTFTAGVNTTGTGEGMWRLVSPQSVASAATFSFAIGALIVTLG